MAKAGTHLLGLTEAWQRVITEIRHDRVMRRPGAGMMTGGGNAFYRKIGCQGVHRMLHMKKTG